MKEQRSALLPPVLQGGVGKGPRLVMNHHLSEADMGETCGQLLGAFISRRGFSGEELDEDGKIYDFRIAWLAKLGKLAFHDSVSTHLLKRLA